MTLSIILGAFAFISLTLTVWQFCVARRFPLHERSANRGFTPDVTVLKPLKGADEETESCLRSWLRQAYPCRVEVLFGVASQTDPVCDIVRKLIAEHPGCDAKLVFCPEALGANSKVSKLIQLERLARHDVILISDADVWVPEDFLVNAVQPLSDGNIGLVNCFYSLANPSTVAMRWEAVAINADFWSQVLQSRSIKPIDFALGAVMATRRSELDEIGGFKALVNYLADDYRLGNLIARQGKRIEICPVVVECHSAPMTWSEVWSHQLRWARTIRVCQPLPYFSSIISNASLWPLLWLAVQPSLVTAGAAAFCLSLRVLTAHYHQRKLTGSTAHALYAWLVPVKDILQVALWTLSFMGNHVTWRGRRYRVMPGGQLIEVTPNRQPEYRLAESP